VRSNYTTLKPHREGSDRGREEPGEVKNRGICSLDNLVRSKSRFRGSGERPVTLSILDPYNKEKDGKRGDRIEMGKTDQTFWNAVVVSGRGGNKEARVKKKTKKLVKRRPVT